MQDRRELLVSLSAILGSGLILNGCKPEPSAKTGDVFYTDRHLNLVSRYADAIIPSTDTPGAVAAGVPDAMQSMMRTWAAPQTRRRHITDWNVLDDALSKLAGKDAVMCPPDEFIAALKALDDDSFNETTHSIHNEAWTAHRRQKQFIATLYYLSEPGATQELQYELNPEEIIPCAPLSQIGRTWAT